jgi:fructoselysine-6-P-deglycase FrlB-like protein
MTHFLDDILRQPAELQRAIDYLCGMGRHNLEAAARTARSAPHVYLTGIGSSFNAGLSASVLFGLSGRPVYMQDAAELLHFAAIPPGSILIVISRSGQSVEVVNLLAKARGCDATRNNKFGNWAACS